MKIANLTHYHLLKASGRHQPINIYTREFKMIDRRGKVNNKKLKRRATDVNIFYLFDNKGNYIGFSNEKYIAYGVIGVMLIIPILVVIFAR